MLTRDSRHQVPILPILSREQAREKGQKCQGLSHLSDGEGTKGRGSTFESQLQSWFLLLAFDIARGEGLTKRAVKIKFGMLFPREELPDQKAWVPESAVGTLGHQNLQAALGVGVQSTIWPPWECALKNRKSGPFWCLQNYMSSGVIVAFSEVCWGGSENKIETIQQTRGSHTGYELKGKWINK